MLLHSGEFGGSAELCWEFSIGPLARDFRVIAPDWLGFGGTDHQALTRIPDSRVVVLHDAGHLLNIEKADVFNDLVRRFLLDRDSDGGVND